MATVHLRAGPATEYPAFAVLVPGTPLEVYGCEEHYEWCDVQAGPNRGWVDAAYLQMSSGGQSMIVADSGVVLALPVISSCSIPIGVTTIAAARGIPTGRITTRSGAAIRTAVRHRVHDRRW
jgi:uncharacterized protein YraI